MSGALDIAERAVAAPRIAVIGIGEDGWEGLSETAKRLVREAELLVGGKRHLALVPELGQERVTWPSDIGGFVERLRREERAVAILASGDPMLYGVGALVAARLPPGSWRIVPGLSSFALACARLGWAAQETACLSACGRPVEALHAELFDGAHVLLLSADRATPHAAAALLAARGFTESAVTVLEHVGGPRERIRRFSLRDWPVSESFADLNLIAIECGAGPDARALSRAPGLPDDAFAHDGQISKREVRAVTLARLSPRPGQLLWDIGAGSGSIGIEWMRAAPRARAIGIEPRADRAARARANAAALGVPGYHVREGRAPEALSGLARPDAVFIGGGLTAPNLLEACWDALAPGGRLVANAVTLESEAVLLGAFRARGGDLVRLAVSRADPVGGFTGWRAMMPVTQWAVEKSRP